MGTLDLAVVVQLRYSRVGPKVYKKPGLQPITQDLRATAGPEVLQHIIGALRKHGKHGTPKRLEGEIYPRKPPSPHYRDH